MIDLFITQHPVTGVVCIHGDVGTEQKWNTYIRIYYFCSKRKAIQRFREEFGLRYKHINVYDCGSAN